MLQAAIVAGGAGERMRPVTDVPKALLPVRGRPLLAHTLEWLKEAGFSDVFLCLGHGAEQVRAALGDGSVFGLSLEYRIETAPRGTAGAAADLLPRLSEDLLVVYGDLYLRMSCRGLLDFHSCHDAEGTLVIRRTEHPEDSDLVRVDESGRVLGLGRRSDGMTGDLACAAIWVVRRRLLERVPREAPADFARDIFPKVLADGGALRAYRTEEPVLDIGTPQRYAEFTQRLAG